MSFARDVKSEIISKDTANDSCCKVAAAYAGACFGKHFDDKGVIIHTENEYIAAFAKKLFTKIGVRSEYYLKGKQNFGLYEFAVKNESSIEKMLGIFGHSGKETSIRINSDVFLCKNCVNTFISAAFVFCGIITNPEKEYNLEFLSNKYLLMNDFSALLFAQGFTPKLTTRKGLNVLYIKKSEQIEDLLTFMGAGFCALTVMNTKVYKDIRNKANRITNCETANIDKTVRANQNSIMAIEYLQKNNAFNTLPKPLIQVALLRQKMPEAPLKDIAQMCEPEISKSGLAHRFKKIEEIAKQLQNRNSNNSAEV